MTSDFKATPMPAQIDHDTVVVANSAVSAFESSAFAQVGMILREEVARLFRQNMVAIAIFPTREGASRLRAVCVHVDPESDGWPKPPDAHMLEAVMNIIHTGIARCCDVRLVPAIVQMIENDGIERDAEKTVKQLDSTLRAFIMTSDGVDYHRIARAVSVRLSDAAAEELREYLKGD